MDGVAYDASLFGHYSVVFMLFTRIVYVSSIQHTPNVACGVLRTHGRCGSVQSCVLLRARRLTARMHAVNGIESRDQVARGSLLPYACR